MTALELERTLRRRLASLDNWPGALSFREQQYVYDVVSVVSGHGLAYELGPCPSACRPYLQAMIHGVLVPLALPVLLELELSCEDQDP